MRTTRPADSPLRYSGSMLRVMGTGVLATAAFVGCSSMQPHAGGQLAPPGEVVLSQRFRAQYGTPNDTVIEQPRNVVALDVVHAAEAMASDSTYDPMCNRYFPAGDIVVVVFVHACDIPLQSFDRAIVVGAFSSAGRFVGNQLQDFGWLESLDPLRRPPWDSTRARKTKVIRVGPDQIGKPIPFDSVQQRDTAVR